MHVPVGAVVPLVQQRVATLAQAAEVHGVDAERVEGCLEGVFVAGVAAQDVQRLDELVRVAGMEAEQLLELGVQFGHRGDALAGAEDAECRCSAA